VRIEAKYHVDSAIAFLIEQELRAVGYRSDEHGDDVHGYVVSSIYLDDPRFGSYTDKLDGLARRIKYRLRFYSEEIGETGIHLEHKEKDSQITWKRSRSFSYPEVREFVTRWTGPVLEHLDPRAGHAAAVICVQYQRLAFRSPEGDVRINFDTRLRWRGIDPSRRSLVSESCFAPLRGDQVILELKVPREVPVSLTDFVHRWDLHWRATSKYAICVEHMNHSLLS
jgi:hypothetical protein